MLGEASIEEIDRANTAGNGGWASKYLKAPRRMARSLTSGSLSERRMRKPLVKPETLASRSLFPV
jgi:hypothetical protein